MGKISQNKLKVNRLANRRSESIRIALNPFRFSAEYDSNRLYIGCFEEPETRAQKKCGAAATSGYVGAGFSRAQLNS
jgi:hypothetical protein